MVEGEGGVGGRDGQWIGRDCVVWGEDVTLVWTCRPSGLWYLLVSLEVYRENIAVCMLIILSETVEAIYLERDGKVSVAQRSLKIVYILICVRNHF